MPRYYVKKDEKWNVFSSIVDDFLYSDFMSFEELKAVVIGEVVVEKLRDLETLLTNRPKLNTMSFSEAMEIINYKDEAQTESTGSPIGDYRDGVGAWQTDCPWK